MSDPEAHILQLTLLTRAATLAEAILHLAEASFGREAMMMNRALFELNLDARWAAKSPREAEARFVEYARFSQQLEKDLVAKWPELKIAANPGSLSADEIESAKKRFGTWAHRGWTGLSVKQRVDQVAAGLGEKDGKKLRFFHEILHRWSNAELHPSSWSLARTLRRVPTPSGGEKWQFRATPESELAPFALRTTWWTFLTHLELTHKWLSLDLDALEDVAARGAQFLGLASNDDGSGPDCGG